MDDGAFLVSVVVAAILALSGFVVGVIRIQHHYDVNSCGIFAVESGYQTKFVDYNFFDWACLAQREDGKWVNRDALRDMQ